jgi:hypothetical protein
MKDPDTTTCVKSSKSFRPNAEFPPKIWSQGPSLVFGRSQLAVLLACQTPLKSGFLAIRPALSAPAAEAGPITSQKIVAVIAAAKRQSRHGDPGT